MNTDLVSAWVRQQAADLGVEPEDPSYLSAVEAWRQAWRPERVRVLLVAESHVARMPGDDTIRVDATPHVARPLPLPYVRLVYCLGYGESAVCSSAPRPNGGTWQYWDLLGQVARGLGELQPRVATSSVATRIAWKVETLDILRRRGIWLVDASVMALYSAGHRVATGRGYARIVGESWRRFVWPDVAADRPELMWIVGHGVAGALASDPVAGRASVIDQPQSRDAERYRRGLATLVAECRRTSP
ncbi:MAG: hypothetical protein K8T90_12220 [Planctomycetes bacterium]|nr:hypothetical protein [Planctomycetota bacterium]